MSKRAFKKILRGVEETRAYLEGTADQSLYRLYPPANGEIRSSRTGMSKPGQRGGWKKKGR